jgi:transposase
MNLHSRARTCPASRELIAKRLQSGAWSWDQAAVFGISERTAFKWLARYRTEGEVELTRFGGRVSAWEAGLLMPPLETNG